MHVSESLQGPERHHPRVSANFTVKAHVKGRTVLTKARDLSMAGIWVEGRLGNEGELLTVSIPLPQDREVLTAGRITRQSEQGVALEFDDLDWDDMFALARYLHPRLP